MPTNKKGYCETFFVSNKNKYKVAVYGCGFSRYVDSKETALKIKEEYKKYGIDYIKNKYPIGSRKGEKHIYTGTSLRKELTYDTICEKLKEKFPDDMVGINKIEKVYKNPKIYVNKKSGIKQKYFFTRLCCTKCGKKRKVNVMNILYTPKESISTKRNKRSFSCICQNISIFKEDYIGKIYGDFKIIDIFDTRKNFSRQDNVNYRLVKVECINCHNISTMTFSALIYTNRDHYCQKCHKEELSISKRIKIVKNIYKNNSSVDDVKNNKSYIKGVWFDKFKQKWCARISEKITDARGTRLHHYFLGEFDNYDDAVAARIYAVEHKVEILEKMLNKEK